MSDIEKKLFDVKDSTKMYGINDRLERIVRETKASAGMEGMRVLSEDELDLVAGGMTYGMSGEFEEERIKKGGPTPRNGLQC